MSHQISSSIQLTSSNDNNSNNNTDVEDEIINEADRLIINNNNNNKDNSRSTILPSSLNLPEPLTCLCFNLSGKLQFSLYFINRT
jgi:hypothetical protein